MKILFVQTGGTIDKDYRQGALSYNFEIASPAVERILTQAGPSFTFQITSIVKKDSMDITDEDRQNILVACRDSDENYIIITHGTDTMKQTAEVLTSIHNKVIILTGASRPERFTNSDACFNIGTAVGAVEHCKPGVYIAMSGRVLSWDTIQKDPTSGMFVEK